MNEKLPLGSFATIQTVGTALTRKHQEICFSEDTNLQVLKRDLSGMFDQISSSFIVDYEEVKKQSDDFVDHYFHLAVRKSQYSDLLKTLEVVFIESVEEAQRKYPLDNLPSPDRYQQIELL